MQKISTYLYPNRVQLLADLASFNVEFTSVYQRQIKIYSGINNTIEFDIKNADQKRIELSTSPVITGIELNVMDAMGNALANSPYTVTPTSVKGIATVTIPQEDLADLQTPQFLRYSVSALKDGQDVLLYGDTRFGAVGTIELVGNAMPTFRDPKEWTTYTGEIDLDGNVLNHFSAMPVRFYEAVKTETVDITVNMTGFIGSIWLEGTKSTTINVEAFRNGEIANTRHEFTSANSTPYTFTVDVGDYQYIRVSFQGDSPTNPTGTIDKVILE